GSSHGGNAELQQDRAAHCVTHQTLPARNSRTGRSDGNHAKGSPHRLQRHVEPLEGLTGIVPTASPPAAARRAEPLAAWAHPRVRFTAPRMPSRTVFDRT